MFVTLFIGLFNSTSQVSYGQSSIGTAVILLVWAVLDALGVILMQSLQSACGFSVLQTGRWVIVTWLQGLHHAPRITSNPREIRCFRGPSSKRCVSKGYLLNIYDYLWYLAYVLTSYTQYLKLVETGWLAHRNEELNLCAHT